MKVFIDYHHNDLFYSLHRLFEERLGWEVYRPIGLDWFHAGYWKIAEPYNNAIDTVNQFLKIENNGWDQYKSLNGQHYIENEIYHVFDPGHDYYQKAITLEKFKSMEFDIVISTISAHDISFAKLIRDCMPKAKHISQMGNIHQQTNVANVLYSVPFKPKANQNSCFYHQEIDLKLYKDIPPDPTTRDIFSMVNLLPSASIYNRYKDHLTDCNFKAFGASCPEGSLSGTKGVAGMMQKANIGWHIKPFDGFGHTAMGWFASGRPVITQMTDVVWYGHDAPQLFIPGVTCLDVSPGTDFEDNCKKIRSLLEPENNIKWGEAAKKAFDNLINYDEEEKEIRKFLERML